jgi:hypothetical protein
MATNFPTSVDVLTNPVSNDSLNSPSHSAQHTNANDAIEAIETVLVPAVNAWTSFTPTLSQGVSTNISKTVTYAKYAQLGKVVFCNIRLSITGTGTAGSGILVSLPLASATGNIIIGAGGYFDASVNNYTGWAFCSGTLNVGLVTHTNGDNLVGVNPNFAVASGDIVNLHLVYETT